MSTLGAGPVDCHLCHSHPRYTASNTTHRYISHFSPTTHVPENQPTHLAMASGSNTTPLLLPPAKPLPSPTLDEIYQAIPPQGIAIVDFAAKFKGRISEEEESFKTLLRLVRTVANLDFETMSISRKIRPTKREIRAAIPPEGISFEDFISLFVWLQLPEDNMHNVSRFLEQIATPDVKTSTIRLKGELTAEEVVDAIPPDGITYPQLYLKFEERMAAHPEDHGNLISILSRVAVWDVPNMRLSVRDDAIACNANQMMVERKESD
jgi:hypothetical protein